MASNAIESVQKHFAKDPPKPVVTRAQNGILKNVEKKVKDQNQSQNSAKSARSDISGEPSLYMTALETTYVFFDVHLYLTYNFVIQTLD